MWHPAFLRCELEAKVHLNSERPVGRDHSVCEDPAPANFRSFIKRKSFALKAPKKRGTVPGTEDAIAIEGYS
jgi:hypothetical protein